MARHASVLAGSYVLSPGLYLQGLLANKQSQYDLAAQLGMPMPMMVSGQGHMAHGATVRKL